MWAKACIVARRITIEKDYYNTHTTVNECVFLTWSKSTRDNFKEMRKAAALFSQTKDLAVGPPEYEHREKYSMGNGYYLAADRYFGEKWEVCKIKLSRGYPIVDSNFKWLEDFKE